MRLMVACFAAVGGVVLMPACFGPSLIDERPKDYYDLIRWTVTDTVTGQQLAAGCGDPETMGCDVCVQAPVGTKLRISVHFETVRKAKMPPRDASLWSYLCSTTDDINRQSQRRPIGLLKCVGPSESDPPASLDGRSFSNEAEVAGETYIDGYDWLMTVRHAGGVKFGVPEECRTPGATYVQWTELTVGVGEAGACPRTVPRNCDVTAQ